ncbi:hypothetical protein SeMB42_g07525 [Synchytrium endobioticum]|uniref:Magnesium transporter n=1 Tax=Synchytrium endobioticum TaxID=286115 RepID=A0A507BU84_9FUNG|nr:hypothetical protein SeMB42_g07525 [Synchytrium endobioticum]TPX42205.1 hypothetical protein SeLEV6574_g05714 [Synchytrium endobioticum]
MPDQTDPSYKIIGIILAVSSGVFIGTSFIFTKKALIATADLRSDAKRHPYLNSPLWWVGMVLTVLGEVFNLVAYAFAPAILVTPLGAVSVVVAAFLSNIFLKEYLSFSGKIGALQCLLGATLVVLHAPVTTPTQTIAEVWYYIRGVGFLIYAIICIIAVATLIFYCGPRWGERQPIVYIGVCSIVGSFVVLAVQGFGSAVVYSFANWSTANQFLDPGLYGLLAFVIATVIIQINFLNKALHHFSTSVVTPVYYVCFTTMTLISSSILFNGFNPEGFISGVTLVVGWLVIVSGVALLFNFSAKMQRKHQTEPRISDDSLTSPDSGYAESHIDINRPECPPDGTTHGKPSHIPAGTNGPLSTPRRRHYGPVWDDEALDAPVPIGSPAGLILSPRNSLYRSRRVTVSSSSFPKRLDNHNNASTAASPLGQPLAADRLSKFSFSSQGGSPKVLSRSTSTDGHMHVYNLPGNHQCASPEALEYSPPPMPQSNVPVPNTPNEVMTTQSSSTATPPQLPSSSPVINSQRRDGKYPTM